MTKRIVALSILLFLGVSTLAAWEAQGWQGMTYGEFEVGFKLIEIEDNSRFYPAGVSGRLDPRNIRIYLWYPAEKSGTSPMTLSELIKLGVEDFISETELNKSPWQSHIPVQLKKGVTKEQLQKIYSHSLTAVRNAATVKGSFPLLILGQGLYYESPLSQFVLCEFLASHGYVVATAPLVGTQYRLVNLSAEDLETQVRDLEFILGFARKFSCVDPKKIGVVGYDLGGMAGLIQAMKNPEIRAFLTMDSGINFSHPSGLPQTHPSYLLDRFTIPWMHMTQGWILTQFRDERQIPNLFDQKEWGDSYLVKVGIRNHGAFTSYAMLGISQAVPGYWGPVEAHISRVHKQVCALVVKFFDAYLKDETSILASLQDVYYAKSFGEFLEVEFNQGKPVPPSESELVNLIISRGMEMAGADIAEARRAFPEYPLMREEVLNWLGYHFLNWWGREAEAVEVFKLMTTLYPDSSNAFDSLGEAYLNTGHTELAIESYKRSLELDPNNKNAEAVLIRIRKRKDEEDSWLYLGQKPPGRIPERFGPGLVSTDLDEYGCTFSPDGTEFYFTRTIPEPRRHTILVCRYRDGVWSQPEPAAFSGIHSVGEPVFSPDGDRLHFGRIEQKSSGDMSPYIMRIEKTQTGWSEPVKIHSGMYASASENGDLYFTDVSGIEDKGEIVRSRLSEGKYDLPKRLIGPVNSRYKDAHPFIAPDESYIIFDSDRPGGLGESDLYIAFKEATGLWGNPINLGEAINTPGYDAIPYVSPDEKYFFYHSDGDIWWADASVLFRLRPKTEFPRLTGPYLGQKPPGLKSEVFAPGIICTTEKYEMNSVFSSNGDEFYYVISSTTKEEKEQGIYYYILMHTKQVDGVWTQPERVPFSQDHSMVDIAFSPDGGRFYFCSDRPSPWTDPDRLGIWYVERQGQGWSDWNNIGPPVNVKAGVTQPSFIRDGSMVFPSARKEGFGGVDIYVSKYTKEKFADPVNLGPMVNSKYNEGNSFVAPDGSYVLFARWGMPESVDGGKAMYISFKKEDGSWTKAMNTRPTTDLLGSLAALSPDGKYLFYSNAGEIYWVEAGVIDLLKAKALKEGF